MSRKKYGKPTMQLFRGERSKKLINYTPKLEARLEDDISKSLLTFNNSVYDLFITVGSSDTVDVLINN